MSLWPMGEIQFICHVGQPVRPEASSLAALLSAHGAQGENRAWENSPLSSTSCDNVPDRVSREEDDGESPDKSYGDGAPNEICAFKLDQGKIDEVANDYPAETCVPLGRGSTVRNKLYKETVKSDGATARNEDESRCKSSRKRKTRRPTSDGVIIDLGGDVYGASRGAIKMSVISIRHPAPKTDAAAILKRGLCHDVRRKRPRSSTRNCSSTRTGGTIDNSEVLVVLYAGHRGNKMSKAGRPARRMCGRRQRAQKYTEHDAIESTENILRLDVDSAVKLPDQIEISTNGQHARYLPEDILSELQRYLTEDNPRSFRASYEIPNSTELHHDDAPINADKAQHLTCSREHTGRAGRHRCAENDCRSTLNDERRDACHVCDEEDYNDEADFMGAELDQAAGCFHLECATTSCRCTCDSCDYCPYVNTQCDSCSPRRAALKNSASPRERQRDGRLEESADVTARFVTGNFPDEHSPTDDRCANCECAAGGSEASATRRCTGAGVWRLTDVRDSGASRREIDARPGTHTAARRDDERPNKSDSQKAADTWDARSVGRGRGGRVVVVAEPSQSSRPDRSPGAEGELVRGVDSKWKHGSIETDGQQLDYKWKRRIATVDANGARATAAFKGRRDSRSQTGCDDTNADGKRRETRDYSPRTSLQVGKIWSQVRDVCRNVVKLAAMSVGRVARDDAASESERSRRNPVEVADATLDVPPCSPSTCASGICGETCRKNLIRSEAAGKSTVRRQEERAIENVGKCREDAEPPTRREDDARRRARKNAGNGGDEKSCVFCDERERDRYRIVGFLPRNETYGHDEYAYSLLSESFTDVENLAYWEFRSRGGSDDNQNPSKSVESQPTKKHQSGEKMETYEIHEEVEADDSYAAGTEKKRPLLKATEILDATEADTTAPRGLLNEPTVSTFKQPPVPISTESQRDRPASGFPNCTAAMRFWRNRSAIGNKAIAPMFKRRRSNGKTGLSATTCDSGMKITQIEPSTVQTAREGNKRRTYVNVQVQTADAIVTRILSELLVEDEEEEEKKKEKRVLMSITLQSESDHGVSNGKRVPPRETKTQTPSNDITSAGTDALSSNEHSPRATIPITPRIVRCFACGKRDCYEIKRSDNSISLQEALIAEYPEESESIGDLVHLDTVARKKEEIGSREFATE